MGHLCSTLHTNKHTHNRYTQVCLLPIDGSNSQCTHQGKWKSLLYAPHWQVHTYIRRSYVLELFPYILQQNDNAMELLTNGDFRSVGRTVWLKICGPSQGITYATIQTVVPSVRSGASGWLCSPASAWFRGATRTWAKHMRLASSVCTSVSCENHM